MASMQIVKNDKLVRLISMEEEAKAAAHDVRSVGMGLNIEKRFWKFSMILKLSDPSIRCGEGSDRPSFPDPSLLTRRHHSPPLPSHLTAPTRSNRSVLVADVDAIATNALN